LVIADFGMRIGDRRLKIEKQVTLVIAALLILLGCAAAPQHPSRIQVTGSRNLRDLGGYHTVDGREIKQGVLYRSDSEPDWQKGP